MRGSGEVEEVSALGVVELERASQRLQHALRNTVHVAALQTDLGLGRARLELVPAGATHQDIVVLGVDSFFHNQPRREPNS